MSDELEFDLAAAGLRADRADLGAYVEGLAARLEGALGESVRVERRRRSVFGGAREVRAIGLQLGDAGFSLRREGGRVECRREVVVRGVRIRGEDLELDAWLEALGRELQAEAASSSSARAALERLLT